MPLQFLERHCSSIAATVTTGAVLAFLAASGSETLRLAISHGLDSGKYWTMAGNILDGRIHDIEQWWLWSVGFPLMLAGLRWLALHLHADPLWFAHVVFALLHGLAAALVCRIAITVTRSRLRALAAGLVFGLFPPLVQLQTFIMSEHVAIPMFVAAIWAAIRFAPSPASMAASGAAFGLAFLARPALGPAGLVLAGLALQPHVGWRANLRNMASLALTFTLFVVGAAALERFASDGRIQGISPNAGVAYMIAMCHPAGYAFVCPECRRGDCPLAHVVTPGVPYREVRTDFASFMEAGSCIVPKGGAGATAKVRGTGNYLVFPSPPWSAQEPRIAAQDCIAYLGPSGLLKRLAANVSLLLSSVDNLTIYRQPVAQLLSGVFVTLTLGLICIGIGSALRSGIRNPIIASLAASAAIPLIMAPFLVSVSRYLLPYVACYAILALLPDRQPEASP